MARDLRLNCVRCGRFTPYEVVKETSDSGHIVDCESCGKRHSDDSIYTVDLSRKYERDEAGNLLEDLP
jgi:uncharacterized Zn finger protein